MKKTEDILIGMGITPDLKGFHFICDALNIIEKFPEGKITKIYKKIGEKYNLSWGNVQRSIRFALAKIDESSEAYKKYINIKLVNLDNSSFLYLLKLRLTEEENDIK